MNVAFGDRKSSSYCHWREAWQKCVCQAIASKQTDSMAAVAASGSEYDGGNQSNTKLTTGMSDGKSRCSRALYELDGKLRTALMRLPYTDARFIRVVYFRCKTVPADSELRMGVWVPVCNISLKRLSKE